MQVAQGSPPMAVNTMDSQIKQHTAVLIQGNMICQLARHAAKYTQAGQAASATSGVQCATSLCTGVCNVHALVCAYTCVLVCVCQNGGDAIRTHNTKLHTGRDLDKSLLQLQTFLDALHGFYLHTHTMQIYICKGHEQSCPTNRCNPCEVDLPHPVPWIHCGA